MNNKIFILLLLLIFGAGAKNVAAQDSPSVLYIPLIGITSVPDPLVLPAGGGNVTYRYAVKNFLREVALSSVHVFDDKCSPVRFITGDDNRDSKLDFSETWRYACTDTLSETTKSVATATGVANGITATHYAYATVIVGSNIPPPLVSIVNTTKVAYPFSGGRITYTYKVNNPGAVPLSEVTVTDDKCSAMSGKLGDTNGNGLLDINEVWIYNCPADLARTTTNTATVRAFANGMLATGTATLTVKVIPIIEPDPLLDVGISSALGADLKITVWKILAGVLATLLVIYFVFHLKRKTPTQKQ